MDTKRLLTTMLIIGAVMLLWPYVFGKGGNAAAGKKANPMYPAAATLPAPMQAREAGAQIQSMTLGSAAKALTDKLSITINNQTAGIEKVELNINDYAETIKREGPLTLFSATPGLALPFSTLGVHVTIGNSPKELAYGAGVTAESAAKDISDANGKNILDTKYVWKVVRQTPGDIDLLMSLNYQEKPLVEITKNFHFDPSSYEVTITHTVRNLSDMLLHVQIDQLGASELPRDDPQADDRVFQAMRLDSTRKDLNTGKAPLKVIAQVELPKTDGGTKGIGQMTDYANDPYLWVSSGNRFFVTIERPLPMAASFGASAAATASAPASGPAGAPAGLAAAMSAAPRETLVSGKTLPHATHVTSLDLDLMNWAEKPADVVAIVRLTGTVVDVAPMSSVAEPMSVYMGPKKRDVLAGNELAAVDSTEYSHSVYQYKEAIQLSQGGCYSFCTREEVVTPILWLLGLFHNTIAFGNYGIAIMVLVIVVRAAMHPLTRASQINMAVMGKKMKDVAPQVEAVKKKYAGNAQKIREETMRVYQENKVNAAGGILGCLPMLIQMPIWAALWSGLRTDIDLRHASFIPGWINDLSHPDTILPTALPVIGHPLFTVPLLGDIYGLNLLPLLLGAVFFIQMKVTSASQPKPADESQAQMQKMSQYMIFIFPLFLYSAPSGLNLYIFASTMGGLLDTWLVRKSLKKRGILPSSASTLPTHAEK